MLAKPKAKSAPDKRKILKRGHCAIMRLKPPPIMRQVKWLPRWLREEPSKQRPSSREATF